MTDTMIARKMHRTLEPYHGLVYFAVESFESYALLGTTDARVGYFGSRAAAMGEVPAEVVVATFFNFAEDVVHEAIPAAWAVAGAAQWSSARLAGIDAALTRILGDTLAEPEVAEAAGLARRAAEACESPGRPLFAGHASLAWPEPDHLVLWHAVTLLREYRGDGHVAALVAEGISPCEALVLHEASGDLPAGGFLQASRGRSTQEWEATTAALADRGWLGEQGTLTEIGAHHREAVERRTDAAAMAPWDHLGRPGCDQLRALVRPLSRAIVASGSFGG